MTKLYSIKEELETQDNRGTQDPFYCVFEKHKIAGDPDRQDCTKEYYQCDGSIGDRNDVMEFLKENEIEYPETLSEMDEYDFDEWVREKAEINFWHYHEINEFETACFTNKAAQKYIDENAHNLSKPFICVHGMYRNGEMKTIREFLMKHDLHALRYYSDKEEFENVELESETKSK